MGFEKLEEALLQQRQDFADTEIVPLIAKVLEIEEATVVRVVAALLFMLTGPPHLAEPFREDPISRTLLSLDEEIRESIVVAIRRELARARIARHIEEDEPLNVYASVLLGDNIAGVCEGCPQRLRCMAENLSTPAGCRNRHVQVRVVSLKETTARVVTEHPKGQYTIDIMDLPNINYIQNPFGD
jgi:hypothetical protein